MGVSLPPKESNLFKLIVRIMESIPVNGEVGGAGGAYSYNALKTLDDVWSSICSSSLAWGGTLVILIAMALSCNGLRVGIVEKSVFRGSEQEWNISRKEILELVEFGFLKEDDIDHVTTSKQESLVDHRLLVYEQWRQGRRRLVYSGEALILYAGSVHLGLDFRTRF
ncbi:hypothetical protein PHJA_001273200 [Phtheirospermum japonicum]|uniref:Uncharacterized protein n=1 Tax=Phtheirospermum japonicum TaxID=374723 RepID=A0A830BZH5_9LAMI|nr:hypothetical protein PHJA_001273200 [Phtheirospermum japonicum]